MMETVSLDELVADAAMLTRVDRKYVLPAADLPGIMDRLEEDAPGTRVLEIDGRTAHGYRSVYFDTPELTSFRMGAHPRRHKFTLRTRMYADTGESFLEFKTIGPRGLTIKNRFPLLGADAEDAAADRLSPSALDWVAENVAPLIPDYAPSIEMSALRPVMWGSYQRTTLLLPDEQSRSTIDTALTWRGVDTDILDRPQMAIVETKSGSRPSEMDRVLWRCGHRRTRMSKYATGMAALHPHLPHNRWHRVLNQYFSRSTPATEP